MNAPGGPESLARLRRAFEDNFQLGRECGASLCVWKDGREKLVIHGGFRDAARKEPWTAGTLVLVWSATKGPASACLLRALDEAGLDASIRVAEVWPEFAAAGKEAITVADMLSHRAGLCAVAERSLHALDHEAVAAALAAQPPAWPPGSGHGYSPRALGYFIEEMVRRLAGMSCGEFWRSRFAGPFDLDFWMGLPEAEHPRAAQTLAPRASAMAGEKTPFARELATPGSLTHAAFSAPGGI
ncbi:MAG: beta-lactamase family protein, partial [Terrimicrobiaceae bacterium]|nr:beta-lactamase family protein [Terrimicrobiaceae bacterium]